MGAFVIVAVPVAFLINVFKITALMILKGSVLLQSIEPGQTHDIAAILLKTGSYSTQMVQLYWGLWLLPFGWLVYKSGFIPRIFGVLLILNGIAYVILSFTFILFPESQTLVSKVTMPFLFSGELPIILWFLIKGVKEQPG